MVLTTSCVELACRSLVPIMCWASTAAGAASARGLDDRVRPSQDQGRLHLCTGEPQYGAKESLGLPVFPQQRLNLGGCVHGAISRRQFPDGVQRFAVGLTGAAFFELLPMWP
jgi:hypothetical protein